MKQIKTVIEPIERTLCFDVRVNCLIIDGWELKKRDVINGISEPTEAFNTFPVRFLYAELEKDEPPYPEEITL